MRDENPGDPRCQVYLSLLDRGEAGEA
jgi:hypothetical protein